MQGNLHIIDAKDTQITYVNAGMTLAPRFWWQTPETGFGVIVFTIAEAQVKILRNIYTLQQKKLCMVKNGIFFQPWQIAHWNKLSMKAHVIFQMLSQT